MPAPTLIKAKVKYAANNPKDFGNGPRINVVATATNGEEIKLWGSPDDAIANLRKGQEIEILQEQKGNKAIHRLLQHAEDMQQPVTTQPQNGNQPQDSQFTNKPLSADQKKVVAAYIEGQADLLSFCWDTARAKLKDRAGEEESVRCFASTLFIAASKKFQL